MKKVCVVFTPWPCFSFFFSLLFLSYYRLGRALCVAQGSPRRYGVVFFLFLDKFLGIHISGVTVRPLAMRSWGLHKSTTTNDLGLLSNFLPSAAGAPGRDIHYVKKGRLSRKLVGEPNVALGVRFPRNP